MSVPSKPTEQSKRFIEKARELDCDENEDAFKEKLKKLTMPRTHSTRHRTKKQTKRD